jgi:hypothetical protein
MLKIKGEKSRFRIIAGTLGFRLKNSGQNMLLFQIFFLYLWRLFEKDPQRSAFS